MSRPTTPVHPDANEELDLNDINELDEQEVLDLDLNPDLEDEDPLKEEPINKRRFLDDDTDEMYDKIEDFKPRINVSSPFSSGVNLPSLNTKSQRSTSRRLSLSQQSKFITYCDEKLMNVQRKFVQSRGLNTEQGYSGLSPLLTDLKSLVDFIWFSIDAVSNTESLIDQDLYEVTRDSYANTASTNFGQTDYLFKIADDLLDYIEKFELRSMGGEERTVTLSKVFKFLIILDKIFARLLDGTVPGQSKMNGTEIVRCSGIAERTRVRLPQFFGSQDIHGYHYELSKIYEETLERCG